VIGVRASARLASAALSALAVAGPGAAWAGGYDTPMLYSARHMGMGGTAIGYVEDGSALFHNPAGLGHIGRFSGIADFSLLLARIRASPVDLDTAKDIRSKRTVAPLFLLGGGLRLHERVVVGLGVYPIASAGAKYRYYRLDGSAIVENSTRVVFLETSPGVAVNLPGNVRLGAGYRVTYVGLERFSGLPGVEDERFLDFNRVGFRVGAQWTPLPGLEVGAVYRHKVTTTVSNDTGLALGLNFTDVKTKFVLPSKLGLGGRYDIGDFGMALDFEHLWNSQNDGYPLEGVPPATDFDPMPMSIQVANVFDWKNELTLRTGVEYRLLRVPWQEASDARKRLALRLGYVFDGETTNPQYPSAFGTPPGPTQLLTAGAGWRFARWQINAAYAYRFGKGDVTPEDLSAEGRRQCLFCSVAGERPYRLAIHGLYIDVSFALD